MLGLFANNKKKNKQSRFKKKSISDIKESNESKEEEEKITVIDEPEDAIVSEDENMKELDRQYNIRIKKESDSRNTNKSRDTSDRHRNRKDRDTSDRNRKDRDRRDRDRNRTRRFRRSIDEEVARSDTPRPKSDLPEFVNIPISFKLNIEKRISDLEREVEQLKSGLINPIQESVPEEIIESVPEEIIESVPEEIILDQTPIPEEIIESVPEEIIESIPEETIPDVNIKSFLPPINQDISFPILNTPVIPSETIQDPSNTVNILPPINLPPLVEN